MAGIFNSLNIANSGMNAQQTALHTVGHNISNSKTEGYSRQRVELKAGVSHTMAGVGQLGAGVKMQAVTRTVDDYVSRQIREEGGSLSRYDSKSQVLGQIEIIYNEPSVTGLNFSIGEVFASFQELGKNPENLSSKTIAVEKAISLSDTFNHIRTQLSSINEETNTLINKEVMDLNALLNNLDGLNQQIFNISIKGYKANDLLDQRDLLLKNVSNIININASFDKWDRVTISNDTFTLLGTDGTGPKAMSYDAGVIKADTDEITLTKGSIKGYMDAKVEILDQISNLDQFGKGMSVAFNQAHRVDEFGVDVPLAIDFYIYDDTNKTLNVNNAIINDNNLVLAGKTYGSPPGDGSRALSIAKLKDKSILFGGEMSTIENKYNTMITKVGISKQHADNMVSNQSVLLGQLEMRRESTSGVSIDEEVANMITFQKAFEANARVIATLTEMLDVLINRTGV